ncbi:hypothetical protein CMV_027626 [Castanea mollissima]|uniref:Uncharacterized protein n=1 Tax=Castanea mollissima TaxID=60419 RepID=A0A8J4QBF4_9ROSI|nr:hypothetical protein CMV_027626 [Castanea mollissima]
MQLREYIDDTEDYINIQLDNHRNQLIQLELFLSSGTVCLSIYSLIAGIFGVNIPYTWNNGYGYMFKWVIIVSGAICAFLFILIISYARYKGLHNNFGSSLFLLEGFDQDCIWHQCFNPKGT